MGGSGSRITVRPIIINSASDFKENMSEQHVIVVDISYICHFLKSRQLLSVS